MKSAFLKFRMAVLACILGMLIFYSGYAQQGFSYQAVARNPNGTPMADQPLTVRIGIYMDGLDGELVWHEEHKVQTSPLGLFTLVVGGPEAQPLFGIVDSFDDIDWSARQYYLGVQVKSDGDFIDMGGSPIQTVPIAQFATTASSAKSSFSVQPGTDALPDEALFEVRRKDGQPVFAVYEDMVWVYVDTTQSKARKGGFAVGGYNQSKGVTQEYLRVSPDSVRIYIDSDPLTKGRKGGFAVGGYNKDTKGAQDDLYLNVSGNSAVDVVEDKSQIMWYPRKEAFLSGNIHIGRVDSVGQNSTAMGYKSIAMGDYSQAFGYKSKSIGNYSTSFGNQSVATGEDSYALGSGSEASGNRSFAIGVGSKATGYSSMALGTYSEALQNYATSIGYRSEASGLYAHAFGLSALAQGDRSMALGMTSTASGNRSLSLGYNSTASHSYAMSIGVNSTASGDTAISIGSGAQASGPLAVALGAGTSASGKLSTAIGYNSEASGYKSISMGGKYSRTFIFLPIIIIPPKFPKGGDMDLPPVKEDTPSKAGSFVTLPLSTSRENVSNGTYSVAIGNGNLAEDGGTALGVFNDALNDYSMAVGFGNQAAAPYSFAGGFANRTDGQYATAFGRYTSAASLNCFTIGTYNVSTGTPDDWIPGDPLFQIGNGSGPGASQQHDAFRVNKNGSTYIYPQEHTYGLYVYGNNNHINSYSYNRVDTDNTNSIIYGLYSRVYSTANNVLTVYSGHFSGNISSGNYLGLYADVRSGAGFDVAEYYHDGSGTEPGDVVIADKSTAEGVVKSDQPYQTSVLGVISTDPHLVMGLDLVIDRETGESIEGVSATRLALTGRVPVKVTEENGPVEPGDLLTTSSTPGHAMKWSLLDVSGAKDFEELKIILAENERRRNAIIGKAVSSSADGKSTVMVLVSLQ
jgi:hypothetical protein